MLQGSGESDSETRKGFDEIKSSCWRIGSREQRRPPCSENGERDTGRPTGQKREESLRSYLLLSLTQTGASLPPNQLGKGPFRLPKEWWEREDVTLLNEQLDP